MSINLLAVGGALLIGVLLGAIYFGGLFITVQRLPETRRPGLMILGSFLARIAVVGVVFYLLLTRGDWVLAPAAVLGFIAARIVMTRSEQLWERAASRLGGVPMDRNGTGGAEPRHN